MSIFLPVLSILVLVIGIPIGYWLGNRINPRIWEMGGWPFMRILATRYHSAVEESCSSPYPSSYYPEN